MSVPANHDTRAGCRLVHATPGASGAIAVLQLVGDCNPVLHTLTGREDWPVGRLRLANIADIDEGLVVRLTEDVAQLMPHGGPRVVQRLIARLLDLGVRFASVDSNTIDPCGIYPEAVDRYEALMLRALARAESPLAIDLLLDQPRRWRSWAMAGGSLNEVDFARSRRLNRLIWPPTVVLAGRPNVGKSTLSNALLGRSMSIECDQPGTTRDYTVGRIDLGGLVVNWHDTPGIRASDDAIETRAIELARALIASADLLIAMADAQNLAWPELPREPDVRVINKCDLIESQAQKPRLTRRELVDAGQSTHSPRKSKIRHGGTRVEVTDALLISARTSQGIAEFVTTVRDLLVPPADLAHPGPWLFDDALQSPAEACH